MKATERSIRKFLEGAGKQFIIPLFQRNYTWSKTQCYELFEDIINIIRNNERHYLGNIIYYITKNISETDGEIEEYILIDGQQRLTTILIILCALRDLSKEKDSNLSERIHEQYLYNKYNATNKIRLKQTEADQSNFDNLIENHINSCNGLILDNYNLFINLIKKENYTFSDFFNAIDCIDIVDINLQIENENNLKSIQTIFEKINSTGIPLSKSDLIRNYILLAKNTRLQKTYYDKWQIIETTVKNENLDDFIRNFLTLQKCEYIKLDDIYIKFKDYVGGKDHKEILINLEEYAYLYSKIINKNTGNSKVDNILDTMSLMQWTDVFPLLLLVFKIEPNDKLEILNLLTDFLIRYRIVKPYTGGRALQNSLKRIIEEIITDNSKLTKKWLKEKLSSNIKESRFPTDKDFKDALIKSNQYNYTYARAIYSKIESYLYRNNYRNMSEITIEHIMPQNLSDTWKKDLGTNYNEIQEMYLNTIGNLTPISKSYNSSLGNKKYSDKRLVYPNVEFSITKKLADDYVTWTEENLLKRNKEIANLATNAVEGPDTSIRSERLTGTFDLLSLNSISITGTSPNSIIINNNNIDINKWIEILKNICLYGYNNYTNTFEEFVENCKNDEHPIISINKEKLRSQYPYQIPNSIYYVETNYSANSVITASKKIAEFLGIEDIIEVEI